MNILFSHVLPNVAPLALLFMVFSIMLSAIFLFASSVLLYKLNLVALGPLFILVHIPLLWLLLFGDGSDKLHQSLPAIRKSAAMESQENVHTHILFSISDTLCAFVAFFLYKKN